MTLKTVLSLDPGVTSIGWCLTKQDEKENIVELIDGGVRIFNATTEAKTAAFKNVKRREKRLSRRNSYRKMKRNIKLENFLYRHGLLNKKNSEYIAEDISIQTEIGNPYQLRTDALHRPIQGYELSFALCHLAKKRGFLSSKKSKTDEDKLNEAKSTELFNKMQKEGYETVGEFFFNELKNNQKVVGQHQMLRKLIQEEFLLILERQKNFGHLSQITDQFIEEIYEIVFYQRPLKIQSRVSLCKLETKDKIKKYTASKASVYAQKFILLQFINNLKYSFEGEDFILNKQQKIDLFELLWKTEKITYKRLKKELHIDQNAIFNFEENEKSEIKGNQILTMFGKEAKAFFLSLSFDQQDKLMTDILTIQDIEGENLLKRVKNVWTSDEKIAEQIVEAKFNIVQGYVSLCTRALKKIIIFLEQGFLYHEALSKAYPNHSKIKNQLTKLPPIEGITNQAVLKSCTQVRHLVNKILDTYGSIDTIKIELARELSMSKKQKIEVRKQNNEREKLNQEAIKFLKENNYISSENDSNVKKLILKYRLWKQSKEQCLYPSKDDNDKWCFHQINANDLFSGNKYEIEHIIPLSISGDDSNSNKALCPQKINQDKGQRTPFEYYKSIGAPEEVITDMIKNAYSCCGKNKGIRFSWTTNQYLENNPFEKRYLNDTQYIAKFLSDYLSLVSNKIITSKGGFTSMLRQILNLNSLLGNEDIKNRDDLRHHFIDAFCTNLISPNLLHKIEALRKIRHKSDKSEEIKNNIRNRIQNVLKEFHHKFDTMLVSHEEEIKAKGEFEEETLYGIENFPDGTKKLFVHKNFNDIKAKLTPKELLNKHKSLELKLPEWLVKYIENNDKYPDIINGCKRIKVYYAYPSTVREVKNNKGEVIGVKKLGSNHCYYIYEENDALQSKIYTKYEMLTTKLPNEGIKLFKGSILKIDEIGYVKITSMTSLTKGGNMISFIKNNYNSQEDKKIYFKDKSLNFLIKNNFSKINVNILGKIEK